MIPTPPGPTVAELQAQLQRERAAAKAEIDRLTAAADYERQQANEALSQLHDAKETAKATRTAIFLALGLEEEAETSLLRLLAIMLHHVQTLRSDFRAEHDENQEACHLLMLLGVKPGFLPDMIADLLPPARRLLLRIRNETQTKLAIDNLSLQQVVEDDPHMVEAVARYREAVALRMAAEPVRDHSPDVGKMVEE